MKNIMFLPTDKMQIDFIEENQDTESLSNFSKVPWIEKDSGEKMAHKV